MFGRQINSASTLFSRNKRSLKLRDCPPMYCVAKQWLMIVCCTPQELRTTILLSSTLSRVFMEKTLFTLESTNWHKCQPSMALPHGHLSYSWALFWSLTNSSQCGNWIIEVSLLDMNVSRWFRRCGPGFLIMTVANDMPPVDDRLPRKFSATRHQALAVTHRVKSMAYSVTFVWWSREDSLTTVNYTTTIQLSTHHFFSLYEGQLTIHLGCQARVKTVWLISSSAVVNFTRFSG